MKTIRLMPLLTAGLLVILLAGCGPSYVGVGTGPAYGPGYYGPRPYYNYGYRPYGYYGYRRPPVIVAPPPVIVQRPRYYSPAPRYYNSPNARGNYGGGGYGGSGGRSRGPR